MSMVVVTIYYGGIWHHVSYHGGENRTMLVQQAHLNFESFIQQIQRTFSLVEPFPCTYVVRCFIPSPLNDGTPTLVDITDDAGLKFCIGIPVRVFYISTPSQAPVIDHAPMNFTDLLNSQIPKEQDVHLCDHPVTLHQRVHNQTVCEESSERSNNFTFNSDNAGNDSHCGFTSETDFVDDSSEDSLDLVDEAGDKQLVTYAPPEILPNSPAHRYIDNEKLEDIGIPAKQWLIPGADFQATVPIKVAITVEPTCVDYIFYGATFDSKDKLVIAVGMYHLKNKVELFVSRSNSKYYYVRCKNNKYCHFEMRATSSGSVNFWRITHFKAPHTCKTDLRITHGRSVSAKVIGAYFAPRLLKSGTVLKLSEMKHHLEQEYEIQVHYNVALAGRNNAIKLIYGDSSDSFQMLPSYLHMVKECNPGSFVSLQTSKSDVFEYAFMSLGCSINGFLNHLRPVIIIDGTHLKGSYKGVLYVATAMDGNEQIFPLAVGIGDKESDKSWIWFLSQLRACIGCPRDLIFISDQHVSILNAVATVFPDATHGLCYYHLRKNLAKFGTHVLSLFGNAVYCYRKDVLDRYMDEIMNVSPEAHKRLLEIKPEMWSRSYCPVRRYAFLTSNYAESVNSSLRWARRLPVCTLLECVRTLINKWFVERRDDAMKRLSIELNLTDAATKRLHESITDGRLMSVETINAKKFCVRSGGKRFMVDLGKTTCSCREFDLILIPCQHAAAAIVKSSQLPTSFASVYYSTKSLLAAYSMDVNPTPDMDEWVIPQHVKDRIVLAPNNPKQAGRPRLSRMRHHSESSSSSRRCSRCKQKGHNRASCSTYKEHTSAECSQSHPNPKRRASCSICSESGHTKKKCPSQL